MWGNHESKILSVCVDCVYFNAYGRLDDQTMDANPNAAEEHRAKIVAQWGEDTAFTSGCGRDCPEHGFLAATEDFPHVEDWLNAHPGETEDDYNDDIEDCYEDSRDYGDSWFSWSACEECGSTLGGDREHATAWYLPETHARGR